MQTTKYGIRAWNNTSDKKCHHCGTVLGDKYIRVNSIFFCSMVPDGPGFSAKCFSEWAVNHFPRTVARRMILEIPTPDMQP